MIIYLAYFGRSDDARHIVETIPFVELGTNPEEMEGFEEGDQYIQTSLTIQVRTL